MTAVTAPLQPHELPKPLRRGIDDIVRRVAAFSVMEGDGHDLLLRVYMAGLFHGVELGARAAQTGEAT